jgi:hypothetical protein
MERLVELRGRCRRQTSSLVMFYRYQQSLIDEAATTLGALLQRSFYFAPRPHHVVIAADQSGQIPARVLRLSHSAKKTKRLGGATGATESRSVECGVALAGPGIIPATFALNPLHPASRDGSARLKDLTSQARHARRAYSITSSDRTHILKRGGAYRGGCGHRGRG